MSGEYYATEAGQKCFGDRIASDDENIHGNQKQDTRLYDIEEQLEKAENRCNDLKDQLDYMKELYEVSKSPKSPKNNVSEKNGSISDFNAEHVSVKRQSTKNICTDNTGAAVRTINSILNGITDSVNRLSELHVQITETPRGEKMTSASLSPRGNKTALNDATKKKFEAESCIIPEIILDGSSTALYPKSKSTKRKAKESLSKLSNKKISSQNMFKRASKEKRFKTSSSKATILEKNSTCILRKFSSKIIPKSNKLVEIYHNEAAKHSDSDEGIKKAMRRCKTDGVPPLNITVSTKHSLVDGAEYAQRSNRNHEYVQHYTLPYDPPEAPRTDMCCYSKNYELPTVASRMKQVAKSYLRNLNFKAIPFCAAISTTPSHNIGINIQQVMNIIKNKQRVNGISPTLVHNIGLAAEKLNNAPFSIIMSSLDDKMGSNFNFRISKSRCPLSKTFMNYPQLQEMAKCIPEDTIAEGDETVAEPAQPSSVKRIIITGPSGDVEVQTCKTASWKAEPVQDVRCTCAPRPNVDIHQVANKYRRNLQSAGTANTITYQTVGNAPMTQKQLKPRSKYPLRRKPQNENTTTQAEGDNENPLNGRERNLKEVLQNLHTEFETLTNKYDELSQKVSAAVDGNGEETIKELERLELDLNRKEEDITMVMTLYKEVMELKRQVKTLKEKRSQASISSKEQTKDAKLKFKEYNNPEAAFHLTKLLKQIQHYQLRYKNLNA